MFVPIEADPKQIGRLIVGLQPVREAIRVHGPRLSSVIVARGRSPRLAALLRFARDQKVPVRTVSSSEIDRVAAGVSHQGAATWGPALSFVPSDQVLARKQLLALGLEGIQDPQNFGAAVRSAVGIASAPILWAEHASAPLSTAMFRASAGAVEHAELCRVPSLADALTEARSLGVLVVGLDAHAPQPLTEVNLMGPTLLIIGSELTGLGKQTRRALSTVAHLVPSHTMDSLNASVAAGIALYEATRQRKSTSD